MAIRRTLHSTSRSGRQGAVQHTGLGRYSGTAPEAAGGHAFRLHRLQQILAGSIALFCGMNREAGPDTDGPASFAALIPLVQMLQSPGLPTDVGRASDERPRRWNF